MGIVCYMTLSSSSTTFHQNIFQMSLIIVSFVSFLSRCHLFVNIKDTLHDMQEGTRSPPPANVQYFGSRLVY